MNAFRFSIELEYSKGSIYMPPEIQAKLGNGGSKIYDLVTGNEIGTVNSNPDEKGYLKIIYIKIN